jgi:hypothetical protein
MFNRAQEFFPLETAKLTLREALLDLATQGLTHEEIRTEFDSAISREFGSPTPPTPPAPDLPKSPSPQPLTSPISDILKGQLLGSFPGQ